MGGLMRNETPLSLSSLLFLEDLIPRIACFSNTGILRLFHMRICIFGYLELKYMVRGCILIVTLESLIRYLIMLGRCG